jgi:hypothetical protein
VKNHKWLTALKWSWTFAIIVGVGVYFSRHFQTSLTYIQNISIAQFMLSAALLVVGKLFLAEMSRQSVVSQAWKPSYRQMLHLYSTIQLSKYLPGGVWHFVGRFGIYRLNGLGNRESSRALIVENVWLVSSAILVGAMISTGNGDVFALLGLPASPWFRMLILGGCGLVWIAGNVLIGMQVLKKTPLLASVLRQLLAQSAAWLFIGLSFFALLPAPVMGIGTATLSIGGFAMGWALGYLTIFAPSGIGIREAVITAVLAIYIQPQEAAVYAALSRLVWIITEVGLSIFCELMLGSGKLGGRLHPQAEDSA